MACGFVCCAGLGIKQPDVTARLCRNLRYALAHGPAPTTAMLEK